MRLGPETSHLTDFSQCIFPGQYKLGRAVETVCLKQIIRSGSCKCFDFPVEIGTGITQLAAKDIDVDIIVGYVVFYVFVQFVEKFPVERAELEPYVFLRRDRVLCSTCRNEKDFELVLLCHHPVDYGNKHTRIEGFAEVHIGSLVISSYLLLVHDFGRKQEYGDMANVLVLLHFTA